MNRRHLLCLARTGSILAALWASPGQAQQPPAQGARAVGTIVLQSESVPLISTIPGRAVARDAGWC